MVEKNNSKLPHAAYSSSSNGKESVVITEKSSLLPHFNSDDDNNTLPVMMAMKENNDTSTTTSSCIEKKKKEYDSSTNSRLLFLLNKGCCCCCRCCSCSCLEANENKGIDDDDAPSAIDKTETTEECCHRMAKFYQHKFSDIPSLSSKDFINTYYYNCDNNNNTKISTKKKNIILVDVRTKEEQLTSVIANSISLQDFENKYNKEMKTKTKTVTTTTLEDDDDDEEDDDEENIHDANNNVLSSPDTIVITYCTIGYRSGLEARRLCNHYKLHGRIYNLDGIISYSHAIINHNQNQRQNDTSDNNENQEDDEQLQQVPKIINPLTNKETNVIHTFGYMWSQNCINTSIYETTYFSSPLSVLVRTIQVGYTTIIRTLTKTKDASGP